MTIGGNDDWRKCMVISSNRHVKMLQIYTREIHSLCKFVTFLHDDWRKWRLEEMTIWRNDHWRKYMVIFLNCHVKMCANLHTGNSFLCKFAHIFTWISCMTVGKMTCSGQVLFFGNSDPQPILAIVRLDKTSCSLILVASIESNL